MIVIIDHISDPSVIVGDIDGLTPDGLPYYDFSHLVSNNTLFPNDITETRPLHFFNPRGTQFTYDLVVLAQINPPPAFVSTPNPEAIIDKPYEYQAEAADPDGDTLTYSLNVGPEEMTIDPETGLVTWSLTANDRGTHTVLIKVEDGRGGFAEQEYTVSVIDQPPNRPPFFTTSPIVDANINIAYTYDANASDPDGDILTFSFLISPPAGMTIDPTSGKIDWLPQADQLHENPVEIRVIDGQGGEANQAYIIHVFADPENNPPIFISEPVMSFTGSHSKDTLDYRYDAAAIDTDGDTLTYYSLPENPGGMTIDPDSGLILWTPTPEDQGSHRVSLGVSDSRGGRDTQEYQIEVFFPDNLPPKIISDPEFVAVADCSYSYNVEAVDPENGPITFSLIEPPERISINKISGLIQWNPIQRQYLRSIEGKPVPPSITFSDSDFIEAD